MCYTRGMKIKETNTRTGESHIYDSEERQKEMDENYKNKMMGYRSPFKDIENFDIVMVEHITDN